MCPLCLTSLAITVATTTGAGSALTALVVRATRSLKGDPQPEREGGEREPEQRSGDRS
jgi:hypothetical protein